MAKLDATADEDNLGFFEQYFLLQMPISNSSVFWFFSKLYNI